MIRIIIGIIAAIAKAIHRRHTAADDPLPEVGPGCERAKILERLENLRVAEEVWIETPSMRGVFVVESIDEETIGDETVTRYRFTPLSRPQGW